MAQRPYQEAFDSSVEEFQNRDDFFNRTGKEAPEWNPNSPLSNFRLSAHKLASLSPGKKAVTLDPIALVHENGMYDRDQFGVVTLTDSEPILRDALKEPNFLPRIPVVDPGAFGKLQLQPLLKVFGPGQKLLIGGGSLGGNVPRFEDGTAAQPSTETTTTQGGGYTESDRLIANNTRVIILGIASKLARVEEILAGMGKP